jgi:hypothetical protein
MASQFLCDPTSGEGSEKRRNGEESPNLSECKRYRFGAPQSKIRYEPELCGQEARYRATVQPLGIVVQTTLSDYKMKLASFRKQSCSGNR